MATKRGEVFFVRQFASFGLSPSKKGAIARDHLPLIGRFLLSMAGGVFDPAKPDPDQDQEKEMKRKEKKGGKRGGGEEKENTEKELEKVISSQPATFPLSTLS